MLMIRNKSARAKRGDLTTGQLVEVIFAIIVVVILLVIFVPLIYNSLTGNRDLNKAVTQNFNTASLVLEGLLSNTRENDYVYSTIYLPEDYSILGFGDQITELDISGTIFKKPDKCGSDKNNNNNNNNPCLCLYKETKVLSCRTINKGNADNVNFMGFVYVSTKAIKNAGTVKVEYTKSQSEPFLILNKKTFENFFKLGTTDKSTDFNNVFFIKVKVGNGYNIYAQPINKFSDLDSILAQQRACSNVEVPCGTLGNDVSFSGYGGIAVTDLPVYIQGCLGAKCNNDQVCMFADKVIGYSDPEDSSIYANIGVYTGECLSVGGKFPLYNTFYDLDEGKTFGRIRQIGDDVLGGPLLDNGVSYEIIEINPNTDCGKYTLGKRAGASYAELGKNCNTKNCLYYMELYPGESQGYNPGGQNKTVNKILPNGVCTS